MTEKRPRDGDSIARFLSSVICPLSSVLFLCHHASSSTASRYVRPSDILWYTCAITSAEPSRNRAA